MAEADGSVVIVVDADDKEAERKLNSLNKKIESTDQKIRSMGRQKMPLVEQSKQLGAELDRAKATLDAMKSGDTFYTSDAIKEQEAIVKSLQAEWDKIQAAVEKYDRNIEAAKGDLNDMKSQAGGLEKQIAAAQSGTSRFAPAMEKAEKSAERFNRRIKEVVRSALIFSMITRGIRAMQEWLGKVVKTNAQANASIARLKGALLTLAQPLVEIIIPAFIRFVDVLARVVTYVAAVVAKLSGSTLKNSSEAAKSLYEQTEALESTGAAAKKASRQLAGFDEINKLTANSEGAGGGGVTAPNFDLGETDTGGMEKFLTIVQAIGAALAGWKIGSALGLGLKETAGLMATIYFAVELVKNIMDAWNNGVTFENLNGALGALTLMAVGAYLAFGKVGAGVALIVGGAALVVTGFRDIIKNGANLQNTLMVIGGIVAAGLGFFALTGSVIPLVIAGIASIVVAVLAFTGNLEEFAKNLKENILGGIIQFIKGVFTGDWKSAWEGVKKVFKGVINSVIIIAESFVNAVIKGINWLIDKINSITITVPDWVPGIGGVSWGPSIRPVGEIKLPRLAQGAVIPPNREFLAVLGDQKHGTNIETPLDTMVQAFRLALADGGYSGMGGAGGVIQVNVMLDKRKVGEATIDVMREIERGRGR